MEAGIPRKMRLTRRDSCAQLPGLREVKSGKGMTEREGVAHLDSSDKHLLLCGLLGESGGVTMDGQGGLGHYNVAACGTQGKNLFPGPSLCPTPKAVRSFAACGTREGPGLPMGPHSSTGSPMTFMMRPSVSRPTGTYNK